MPVQENISYIKEKFEIAVNDLSIGEGDIKSRIDTAYHRFWIISQESFPESLIPLRQEIESLLTAIPSRTGHVIPDNIEKMSNSTASEIASLIVQINNGLKSL